jgi:hypothetical protein
MMAPSTRSVFSVEKSICLILFCYNFRWKTGLGVVAKRDFLVLLVTSKSYLCSEKDRILYTHSQGETSVVMKAVHNHRHH